MHTEVHARRIARRDQFFCTALEGLLANGGWTMDGKKLADMNDYIELARRFAAASLEKLLP